MQNENKKDAPERTEENCKNCGHTRDDHCGAKDILKNPNYLYGHCSKCDCKNFESKE